MHSLAGLNSTAEVSGQMGHVILDRRQEPRFALPGRFRVVAEQAIAGLVIDVSLNGALLEQQEGSFGAIGNHVELLLELDEKRPFAAQARVAHIDGARIGVEFQEIEPAAFQQLAVIVELLKRAPALAKLSRVG